ncbi:MAG: hypothetical protein M1115_01525 [Actinobacteria bacterium]|nr:hypothetical protein [Actinomycetota bacterium]
MIGAIGWTMVVLAVGVVVVRRRSTAIGLVTLQALMLAALELFNASNRSSEYLLSGLALLAKAVFIAVVLGWSVLRTRQDRPILEDSASPVRLLIAVLGALSIVALLPLGGLSSTAVERATIACVVVGIFILVLRKATLFQVLGLLVAENGVAFAATAIRGGMPIVIDLGVIFDIFVLLAVATALHEGIFHQFGTGDASVLRDLRD